MAGMQKEYVELIRERVQIGDTVMWCDKYNAEKDNSANTQPKSGKVIQKYKHFAVTDQGSIQWGLIAGYLHNLANRKVSDDDNY